MARRRRRCRPAAENRRLQSCGATVAVSWFQLALFDDDFTVAVVLIFAMCTAMGQVRGALSRGLSWVNLDVRGDVFVQFLLTLIRSLIGRWWSVFDVNREKERSTAHKMFNITDQTSIQHLQTFSIKRQLAMYRCRLNDVPKRYFACTEVVLQKTHVPKLISYVRKLSCTETVHPFVPKLSCTESDLTLGKLGSNRLKLFSSLEM